MANTDVALSILQLVALSLPAFAILLELMVESEFPFVHKTMPVIAASFGLFIVGGVVVVSQLMLTFDSPFLLAGLGTLLVGLFVLAVGISLVGLRMWQTRREAAQ